MTDYAFTPPDDPKTRRYAQYPRKLWADRVAAREPQPEAQSKDWPHPFRVALPRR